MLSLLILILLISSYFIGLRRGLILQLVHLVGFIAALIVAYVFYKDLAFYIRLWIPYPQLSPDSPVTMLIEALNFETVYYSGIAFAILFIATKIFMQIIGSMLDFLARLPILRTFNRWTGGVLGFLEVYLIIFVLLNVAALIPIEFIQSMLNRSLLAQLIINHTPFLSDWLKDLWIQNKF
ncbi:CvpA family protein [Bacillus sp. FJAT-45350]|uniref:CvpA family protein n=1 Tax=Bacillus sp. FJAT-45350 TaxID=2011014 RepID=UPI000BB7296A|nr:CvpA family protein [Bacillus sp. FJAT-45350]